MGKVLSPCSVDGCAHAVLARGWCPMHYQRWRTQGDPLHQSDRTIGHVSAPEQACSIETCELPTYARTWCKPHYYKWVRNGDPRVAAWELGPADGRCGIEGCDRPHRTKGFCSLHYKRFLANGDALTIIKPHSYDGTECSASECHERPTARGLCTQHYLQEPDRIAAAAAFRRSDTARETHRSRQARRRAIATDADAEAIDSIELFERDGWRCGICGHPIPPDLRWPAPFSASIDHILPLAKGGRHTLDNVQAAHLICNISKGAKVPR